MNSARFTFAALSLSVAVLASSCSFGSKPARQAAAGQQEFDTRTNAWVSSNRVVVPPPSQPATPMTVASAEPEKKEGVLQKVGNTVKKPFGWLPFVGE